MLAIRYLPLVPIVLGCCTVLSSAEIELRLEPTAMELVGGEARQQLLATAAQNGREFDVTDQARFASANPAVAIVSNDGVITPVADGTTQITATFDNRTTATTVTVREAGSFPIPHFANDIIPLFTKAGCNSGACH